MILQNMTYEEIADEMDLECSDLHFFICNKFKAFVKYYRNTTRRIPFYEAYKYVSKRNNLFYSIFIVNERKDIKNPFVINFCIYGSKYGRCICMMANMTYDNRVSKYVIYIPHCLSRYRERFMNDNDMSFEQLAIEFIYQNGLCKGYNVDEDSCPYSKELKSSVEGQQKKVFVCKQGLVFGTSIGERVNIIKTFVPNAMLHDDQIALFEPVRETYKQNPAMDSAGNILLSPPFSYLEDPASDSISFGALDKVGLTRYF